MRYSNALIVLALIGCIHHAPRLDGSYAARLAVTGRSTYSGTLSITPAGGDSVRGMLRLLAPLSVDMPVVGAFRGDSLQLQGTYTVSNGCTGTMEGSVAVTNGGAGGQGPFTLTDKCVGTLTGTMELTR
jgi:hypothetical protein